MHHNRTLYIFAAALLIVGLIAGTALAKPQTLIREEIPDRYKWDLSHVYDGWEEWEADMQKIQTLMDRMPTYKGRLS